VLCWYNFDDSLLASIHRIAEAKRRVSRFRPGS
jgi:hypothetical protein